jgi:hypothetical protein
LYIANVFSTPKFIIKVSQYVNGLLTSTLAFIEKSLFKGNQCELTNPVMLGDIMSYICTQKP